ncbi:MAG: hypothetical protein MSIBF_03805 [Candidatus Altiarchaeales archaeon IMC4]|nr:MAG: hypothetical protein MSIBF_03805 [Candidatus Altiarchaeales archaeon IMC4]
MKRIAVITGDGIGREIVPEAVRVLEAVEVELDYVYIDAGEGAFKKTGSAISAEAIKTMKGCDAILKGPTTTPLGGGFRSIAVTLRQELDMFANVRPAKSYGKKYGAVHDNVDIVIVRENTEGLYCGIEIDESDDVKKSVLLATRNGCERIVSYAFEYAKKNNRKKVTAVHKANILKKTGGLFSSVAKEISSGYPGIEFDEKLVDACAMLMAKEPQKFDVIVTTNLFGDILSDLALGLTGSIGLGASANVGEKYAMFEAVHGSASDIAGKGIANPASIILSSAMMLDHIGLEGGSRIRNAVEKCLKEGKKLTPDLGGGATTTEFTDYVISKL